MVVNYKSDSKAGTMFRIILFATCKESFIYCDYFKISLCDIKFLDYSCTTWQIICLRFVSLAKPNYWKVLIIQEIVYIKSCNTFNNFLYYFKQSCVRLQIFVNYSINKELLFNFKYLKVFGKFHLLLLNYYSHNNL